VDELARKMVERFQTLQEGHRWATEFPPDFPSVPADAERLREVLQNLINNAVKYSPRGTCITVGGWVEPERIGVFVRDEGPGIPLEEQARIFERFVRGRGRSAERAQGAGLGLYLCRAIVEQHGGKIWSENLQHGAAFYFTLPRERRET
jgi:signal transduction histidine kinase